MLKLTTFTGGKAVLLNPAFIISVREIPRERGAVITTTDGQRHEVAEDVQVIANQVEDLRDA